MLCALYCDEAPACNCFRIDSGSCIFGFLPPPPTSDEMDDTQVEVYVKSMYVDICFLEKIMKNIGGQLSTEAGCYKSSHQALKDGGGSNHFADTITMTIAKCMDHCKTNQNKLYILGHLGNSCYCSNSLPQSSALIPDSECSFACSGEPGTEGKCGGEKYKWNVHAVLT